MTDIFINHLLLWLSILVASVCFIQAIYLASVVPDAQQKLHCRLWIAAGCSIALIIIDHQTGIGLKIADLGRTLAMAEGWYLMRRKVQAWTIAVLVLTWVLCAGFLIWRTRRNGITTWVLLIGCIFLLGFAIIRMISLHQVDAWLNERILGIRHSSLLELVGIVIIGIVAIGDIIHIVFISRKEVGKHHIIPYLMD